MSEQAYDNRIPGALSQIHLSKEERELLLDYMKGGYPRSASEYIWAMMGDEKFLMFFDVLEGETIKIPNRQTMAKVCSSISIYRYLLERNFSQEAYEKASCIYGKKSSQLQKIVEQVEKVLHGEEIPEDQENEEDQND